jgi:hypothetical protein
MLTGKYEVKRFTSREVRQALVGRGNLRTRLSDRIAGWNPYQPESLGYLNQIYQQEALEGWQRVRLLFADVSSVVALANTWACIAHLPDLKEFLYAGVEREGDPATLRRVEQLLSTVPGGAEHVSVGNVLSETPKDAVPDLLNLDGFSPELRIRWGLASRVHRKASYLELLQCAGAVESVGVAQAVFLLKEAIEQCADFELNRFGQSQAVMLSASELAIFVSEPGLHRTMYLQQPRNFVASVAKLKSLRLKYASDTALIRAVFEQLAQRNWSQAGQLAADIVVDSTSKLAAQHVFLAIGSNLEITWQKAKPRWSAMSELGHEKLVKLFGRSEVPSYWKLEADELAQKLMIGEVPERSLSILDIEQLGLSWDLEVKKNLIAARCYRVLEVSDPAWRNQSIAVLTHAASVRLDDGEKLLNLHLSDFTKAEEFLQAIVDISSKKFSAVLERVVSSGLWRQTRRVEAMTWDELLSSQIGVDSWTIAVKKGFVRRARLSQLAYAAKRGSLNCKSKAFRAEAVAVLQGIKRAKSADAIDVMHWIEARPSDAKFIAPNLTASLIKKILGLSLGDCSFKAIKRLYELIPVEHRAAFWQMQLVHVSKADHLIELALEGASQGWQAPWLPHWKSVDGSVEQRSRALVLMVRTDLYRLRQLHRLFSDEVISAALLWTAQNLKDASSFEKIFLELSSFWGLRHGKTLRWLLSNRSREKAAGTKFDHLYTKHEIPKKSGKMRVISAPAAGLKRIQKSIAVVLLDPLGAHKAAFGFVAGRSIVDNAKMHVGKPVVVNADVRNCFPSVRWPLVRAALIRDLSDRLSPLSISFLVDLCTAEGVLPIGAPTSPAILNRVLFKTDQILSQQATLRGCSYTRYADDLTFSGGENTVGLLGVARGVLGRIGLELDPGKTNVFRRGRRQMCTGLVVNDRVNVPRRIRRRVRAAVHAFEQARPLAWDAEPMSPSSLRGRLEFMKMVAPETAAPLIKRMDAVNTDRRSRANKRASALKSGEA